jgi:hypothetical protein
MRNFRFATLEEIKSELRRGDIALISEMLKDVYASRTVEAQLTGERKLKKPVIEAANRLIELRKALFNQLISK